MQFLNWCEQHRILVAVYPPHSTHRLQPLDVGCFAPLATFYSQALDHLIRQSQGRTTISKRDFFSIFWPAFQRAFSEKNICSAWSKTGIWPFRPEEVLEIFVSEAVATPRTQRQRKRASDSPPSEFDSPSKAKRLRTVLNATSARSHPRAQKTIEKLGNTLLSLSAKLILSNLENKQLSEALNRQKGRKKRKGKVAEQLRSEGGTGTLFLSPSRVQRARDLEDSREQAKEQLQQDKQARVQERAYKKAEKEAEAQRKRKARAGAAVARKEAEAQRKAAVQQARKAKKAQRQLASGSRGSRGRPTVS